MDLPVRKAIRLHTYNYRQNGAYFVTVCVKRKEPMLWNMLKPYACCETEVPLSRYGLIVQDAIERIPQIYTTASIEKYVIMPNHIHMIIVLQNNAEHTLSIPNIINQTKGRITKQIGFSLFQRSFHDHIIRNQVEYDIICEYIDTNPRRWLEDQLFIPSNP